MNRLQNNIGVITGGSEGMGLASAEQFVAEGATFTSPEGGGGA
jgi:NAD(P)-dependent dehydrogenase (short-subunit alcohol dehydrogenase family)